MTLLTEPKLQTKETALVMLADSCEARARGDRPKNDEEIEALVKSVFDYYSSSGQLDDAPLTLRDLKKIRESFVRVLRNSYHPRVKYPEQKKESKNKTASVVKNNRENRTKTALESAEANIQRINSHHALLTIEQKRLDLAIDSFN